MDVQELSPILRLIGGKALSHSKASSNGKLTPTASFDMRVMMHSGNQRVRIRTLTISNSTTCQIEKVICHALLESYGIHASVSRLPGENLNYLADSTTGEKYVVKIASDNQSESFIEMEYLALQHVERLLPDIQFPQLIENKFGNVQTSFKLIDNSFKQLRLISFLSGTLLETTDISDSIRFNVGKSLARFDQAVAGFDHPAAHREHHWDLARAYQHYNALDLIGNMENTGNLKWAFDSYMNNISGNIDRVKWQFIHGDANPENILVQADQVVGLLDFGDSCYNPRICELAICLPYLMMDQPHPLGAAQPVIAGYTSIIPLTEAELDLLWPLVLGRLATTLSMAVKRRQLDPDHPNWFVSEERAWRLLKQLRYLSGFSL